MFFEPPITSAEAYPLAQEWIRSRDNEESIDGTANDGKDTKGLAAAAALKNDPKTKFIPVPSDYALASLPCPICQENFDPSWNDEAQDFVWMDAEKIGSKVYHASCYSELQKDEADTPRTSTPDSVLGKRKAEVSYQSNSRRPILTGGRLQTATRHLLRSKRSLQSNLPHHGKSLQTTKYDGDHRITFWRSMHCFCHAFIGALDCGVPHS